MKKHGKGYYKTRTVVRFIFWGTVGSLAIIGCSTVADKLNGTDKAVCNVSLNEDFSWQWNGNAVPLTDCLAPEDVILNENGTWDWFNPDL